MVVVILVASKTSRSSEQCSHGHGMHATHTSHATHHGPATRTSHHHHGHELCVAVAVAAAAMWIMIIIVIPHFLLSRTTGANTPASWAACRSATATCGDDDVVEHVGSLRAERWCRTGAAGQRASAAGLADVDAAQTGRGYRAVSTR